MRTKTTTGGPTLNSTSWAMPPHALDVVSNSATARTSPLQLFSDLVQPSRGSPRVSVASPGALSVLLARALTTIFVYLTVVTKSMQLTMSVVVPPRIATRTAMTGRCSHLRTWVGRFILCADGHSVCLGRLVVFGERCMIFLYSRAYPDSISVLVRTYLTVAHVPQVDRTSHSLFDHFLCRLANHTILPHPHIAESNRNPAGHTRILSYVGRLYHLCLIRFLQVIVVRFLSFLPN